MITRVETIKMTDYGYMWLYGCRPKSEYGLGLSVTHSAIKVSYAAGKNI